jgi:hypothetical protein
MILNQYAGKLSRLPTPDSEISLAKAQIRQVKIFLFAP